MRTSLLLRPLLALATVLIVGTACSERGPAVITSPAADRPVSLALLSDTLSVDFVIRTTGKDATTITIGEHKLHVPLSTLCDPNSSYGPTEWDKPCTLASTDVALTAKTWTNPDGTPQIDFNRDLRFVKNKKGELPTITFTDKKSARNPFAKILYCATGARTCIDESLTDPTLVTRFDARNGFIYRIIKHFSGYNVWA